LASVAIIVLIYVTAVVIVNPRGEFPSRRFPWIIPNSRRVKVELFRAAMQSGPVRGIVLGSSRSMTLAPAALSAASSERFFNFAVFSSTIEDHLAILRFVIRSGAPLDNVIVGLDQDALAPGTPLRELTTNIDLATALRGESPTTVRRVMNWAQMVKAAFTPYYAANLGRSVDLAFAPEVPINVFGPDGSLRYVRWDAQIASGTYDGAGAFAECRRKQLELADTNAGHTLDSARTARFEELLRVADSVGAHVTVWLPPYHPALLQVLAARPPDQAALVALRTTVIELTRRYNANFIDLTNPAAFGAVDSWYDCVHYGDANAARIIATLIPVKR
jgi:hypothetical protein